jgi:phenylalanyl-tRNA synthetase alpha chain
VDDSTIAELKKRKLVAQQAVTFYEISRGDGFTTTIEKQETDLTPEMLASGDWKTKKFKAYNFDALGVPPAAGHLHPLMKVGFVYIIMRLVNGGWG